MSIEELEGIMLSDRPAPELGRECGLFSDYFLHKDPYELPCHFVKDPGTKCLRGYYADYAHIVKDPGTKCLRWYYDDYAHKQCYQQGKYANDR